LCLENLFVIRGVREPRFDYIFLNFSIALSASCNPLAIVCFIPRFCFIFWSSFSTYKPSTFLSDYRICNNRSQVIFFHFVCVIFAVICSYLQFQHAVFFFQIGLFLCYNLQYITRTNSITTVRIKLIKLIK